METKKTKQRLKPGVFRLILFVSSALVISVLVLFGMWFYDNYRTKELGKTLQKETPIQEVEDTSDTELVNPPEEETADDYWDFIKMPLINVDFSQLVKRNKDTVAWVQVAGTNINYPVVQTTDNDYYLTHAFNRQANSAGWIYGDYRNNFTTFQDNTILYGHGRWNNTMFGSLRNILTEGWQNKRDNHIVKLSTPKENSLWQVFSVYDIPAESYYLTNEFHGDTDTYQTFLDTLTSRSQHDFETSVNVNDKILTLSTCRGDDEWRVVLHAKLIKKEMR